MIDGGGLLPWIVIGGPIIIGYVYFLNKLIGWWLL